MILTKATPSLILASLLVGIVAGVALSSWLVGMAIWVGAIVVVDLAFVVLRKAPWRDRLLLVGLVLAGLVIGVWRYSWTDLSNIANHDSIAHFLTQKPVQRNIEGTIIDLEADVTSQKIILDDLSIETASPSGRILLFAPGYPRVETGDRVTISCSLEKPEPFEGFAYDRYLASKNIYATCFVREVPFVVGESNRFVALDRLHANAVGVINRTFGEPHSALLAGLLMGDDNFSDEWKERFLRTGTSHVVAASGYNVTMLAFVLFAILISLGLKRQHAFPIVLLGIAAFVSIAGAEAAVTRAGIMGALALSATQLGRKTTPRNIILLTVVIMLLDEPRLLRDDVGFQLSVLSTIGLVTMAKYFSEKFAFIPATLGLRESFAATIAATLATLPIIIFGFGKISIISPFVNLLVLPFVPYAMLTGGIAALIGALDPSLGALIGGPAWLFLSAMLEIIQAMTALPFAIVELPF
jgi:competence protein ComEC